MGAGISAPAVAGGLVFVGDSTGHVDAFDAAGSNGCSATTRVCGALWDRTLGAAAGAPEVANGRVYVGAGDGTVRVFAPS
jgi:outer membrane protein assembly factor BamB